MGQQQEGKQTPTELLFQPWGKPKSTHRSPQKFINTFVCSFHFDFARSGGDKCVPVAGC